MGSPWYVSGLAPPFNKCATSVMAHSKEVVLQTENDKILHYFIVPFLMLMSANSQGSVAFSIWLIFYLLLFETLFLVISLNSYMKVNWRRNVRRRRYRRPGRKHCRTLPMLWKQNSLAASALSFSCRYVCFI